MSFIKEHESVKDNKKEYIAVGGQALIEGIMMKGPNGTAMSVRLPDGTIETEMKDFVSLRTKYKFFGFPIIRGIVSFIESMKLGMKLLMESAEKSLPDEEPKKEENSKESNLAFGAIISIASFLGIALSIFLFMWAPSFLFDLFNDHAANGAVEPFRAILEGILRSAIFVVYLYLTSKMKDIKRVYMYHGAEHKTIFCFEHGQELTVENIKKEKRFHPRCGTSFIFVTIILSIIISSIVSILFPVLTSNRLVWVGTKLLMMPVIMGIGFECIQFAGKHQNKFTQFLSAPGLLVQRITTVEPTDDMIEVAIAAVKAALTGKVEEESKKLSKDEFYKTHCAKCGSVRCEGMDSDWFDGCQYKDELKTENDFFYVDELNFPYKKDKTLVTPESLGIELNNGQSVLERLSKEALSVKSKVPIDKEETFGEFLKKGATSLCEEHPDVV